MITIIGSSVNLLFCISRFRELLKHFFLQSYLANLFHQFAEIVHGITCLEPFFIQSIATNDVVTQSLCGPNSEHCTLA